MSTSEERKREIRTQNRASRQNDAIKAQQVVNQQQFNEPFKYNSVTRKSVAAKNAPPESSSSSPGASGPITILSLNVRLYQLGGERKTPQLMKTTVTNPNSLEIMTHSISITSNNTDNEIINMVFSDFNKNVILSVQIDSLFGWTLLPMGTNHDLPATLGSFSQDGNIYGILAQDIDSISRWIIVCRYYSMVYENESLGYNWIDINQDVVPPLPSAPIIVEGDIVKVNYSLFSVKSLCDYVPSASNNSGQSVLLAKSPAPFLFTVGQGECPIPGVESAVVGMRKRNVKALVIRREALEDGENDDWPISIKRDCFLVVEVAVLNHRQSNEEVSNLKSIVLEDTSNNTSSQRQPISSTPIVVLEKEKKKKIKKSTKYEDSEEENLFNDNPIKKKSSKKEKEPVVTKSTSKSTSKSRHAGPFADSEEEGEEEQDEEEEEEEVVEPVKPTKSTKSTKKQPIPEPSEEEEEQEQHQQSDFEDDEEEEVKKPLKKSSKHQQKDNTNAALPVFQLPGMGSNSSSSPPAAVQQPQVAQPVEEKQSLSERMKKLATNNGMSTAVPTFNIAPVQSPALQPTPSPQPAPQQQQQQQPQSTQHQPQPAYYQQQQQQHQPQQQYYQPQQVQQQQYQAPQPQYQQQQQQQFTPTYITPISSPTTNLQHTVPHLLFQLGLQQYTTVFANEALSTLNDLQELTEADWSAIVLPTGVKRKLRTHIATSFPSTQSQPTISPTAAATPSVIPTPAVKQLTSEDIDEAYQRGKVEATQLYGNKIKELKMTANDKFQEQNGKISELTTELEQTAAENQRNKEIVRQYVEKQRVQQQEQTQQLQLLQQKLQQQEQKAHSDLESLRAELAAERLSLLESVYLQFSSQVNNNDVLDGQQINKTLKEVLKRVATSK